MGRQARLKRERREQRELRQTERQERAKIGTNRGCLICRDHDGSFLSEEHPVPESLGNTEIVLPNGVVCDRCNNTVLSRLDEAVIQFFPVAVQRVLRGVPSKAGKPPLVRLRNGTLSLSDPSNVLLATEEKAAITVDPMPLPGGYKKFKMSITGGKRMTPRYASTLSRALLKAAIECAWIDHGEKVLGPEWDHVRDAVLGLERQGYFAVLRSGDPGDHQLQLQYVPHVREDGSLIVAVVVRFYGIVMGTDSRNPRPAEPFDPDTTLVVEF